MKIDVANGLLEKVNFCSSPNHDERLDKDDIELIVIHSISLPPSEFGQGFIKQLFMNQLAIDYHPYFSKLIDLKVSAHVLIDRNGKLTQFVPFHRRAWHAGVSIYEGRPKCNDYSIGIELEGDDNIPFCEEQYVTLANVTRALLTTYPKLNSKRIVGHSDIAPGRKTDPGSSFDWQKYFSLL